MTISTLSAHAQRDSIVYIVKDAVTECSIYCSESGCRDEYETIVFGCNPNCFTNRLIAYLKDSVLPAAMLRNLKRYGSPIPFYYAPASYDCTDILPF